MATNQDQHNAVFLECMKAVQFEKGKLEAAEERGDTAAKREADGNISAYLLGASVTVPPGVPGGSDEAKQNLEEGSKLFAAPGNDQKKRRYLQKIAPVLQFCLRAKTLAVLATVGGLGALACLAEHHPLQMTDGSIADVTYIDNHDGTTTRAWDENHNGLLDHQDSFNNATFQVVDEPHKMTFEDNWSDIGHGFSEAVHDVLDFFSTFLF